MKNKRMDYASELTKEQLIKSGVTWVDEDTLTVYGVNGPRTPVVNRNGYLVVGVYKLDEEGNRIKVPAKYKYVTKDGKKRYYRSYTYDLRHIGLHRLLWAWHYGKVPAGYVIDHIKNRHDRLEDYRLSNLQCITQAENLAKDRPDSNTKILKAGHDRDIKFYEGKLNMYLEKYERAKRNHDAAEAHRQLANISNNRAKIRYLLNQEKELN